MGKLDSKVAIITGAAAGIGAEIARVFAQEGAQVVIADYNGEGASETANAINRNGGQATSVAVNVAEDSEVQAMVEHAHTTYGMIDILVNNAGVGSPPMPLHVTETSDWDRVVDVNLKGVFLGMKYALPHMMEQKSGTIINIASIAGIIGSPGLTPYAAAKAGVIELTRVVAAEYSRYNIRCNTIAPGWTKTAMVDRYIESGISEQNLLRGIPLRRLGEVSEIAHTALFLAGDEAQFIQGATLVIDGGITAL